MRHILTYGSLRKNSSRGNNFCKAGQQNFIKEVILDGYEMYSFGVYPTICEGSGQIKCELHEVDEKTYLSICMMEFHAYYSAKNVVVDGITATLFYMIPEVIELIYGGVISKVEDGDWK